VSFLEHITVLVLTYNEEENIARTLDAVSWASRIVVVDSGSTDATVRIARKYQQAQIMMRPFDSHQSQWSYGLSQCEDNREWVLALDADYRLSDEIVKEIAALSPPPAVAGYRASFRYCIQGHPLRRSLYPSNIVLFRRNRAGYAQEGHTQRLILDGEVGELRGKIDHDDRKPLSRWFMSQLRYADLEADYLLAKPTAALRRNDRLRLTAYLAPLLAFPYILIVKRCALDGWPGWYYAMQRVLAETLIALEIISRRMRHNKAPLD